MPGTPDDQFRFWISKSSPKGQDNAAILQSIHEEASCRAMFGSMSRLYSAMIPSIEFMTV